MSDPPFLIKDEDYWDNYNNVKITERWSMFRKIIFNFD